MYYPVNYLPVWDTDFRYSGPGRGERSGFSESTRDNQRAGGDDYKERTDTFLRIAQLSELEAIRAGYGKIHSIARGIQQTRENLEVIQEEQFRRATIILETAQADEKKRKEKEAAEKKALRTLPSEGSPSTLPPAKPSKPAPAAPTVPEPFSRSPSPSLGAPKRAHARVSQEQLDAKLPDTDTVAAKKIKTAKSSSSVDSSTNLTTPPTSTDTDAALQKISGELQEKLAAVAKEKLLTPPVEPPKRGAGKGLLSPSPAQLLARDKAAAAAAEEDRKRNEKHAVEQAQAVIRICQEQEHAKFLVRQAADKKEEKTKQKAKKARLLKQLEALQAAQSEEEEEDLVCAEGEEGGLRILTVGVGES